MSEWVAARWPDGGYDAAGMVDRVDTFLTFFLFLLLPSRSGYLSGLHPQESPSDNPPEGFQEVPF